MDELEFDLCNGSIITLPRDTAAEVAQRLWEAGIELPGAVAAAAQIHDALRTRSRYPGTLRFGAREARALRAVLDPAAVARERRRPL